jgi:hypothetical protein
MAMTTRKLKWLRAQLTKLAKDAEDNAAEDGEHAEATRDHAASASYEAASETSAHYARELRRILAGKTWMQDAAARLRRVRE